MLSGKRETLSQVDRKLLKHLLSPDGYRHYSSDQLSKKLGIPASTVQRRRRRLEQEFLTVTYTLTLGRFGWRRVDYFLATVGGKTKQIAQELLKRDDVVFIGRSIGQQTIDLRVETILNSNSEILELLEYMKGMDGVREAVWSEIVEEFGRKASVPPSVIDRL